MVAYLDSVSAPPILPADRHCARYKFLYRIVSYRN